MYDKKTLTFNMPPEYSQERQVRFKFKIPGNFLELWDDCTQKIAPRYINVQGVISITILSASLSNIIKHIAVDSPY